jgi:hypothetical protein
MKQCCKCRLSKQTNEFAKDRRQSDGFASTCKACKREYDRAKYRENPPTFKEKTKAYRRSHPEQYAQQSKAYYQRTIDKRRHYKEQNAGIIREYNRNYSYHRRQKDPAFRLRQNLRNRQKRFLKSGAKVGSFARDMGCDREFFLRHITIQFTAGMTMENYGKVWHLDHIYPLSKADLTDRAQFLAAANWRNIQPMLGPENVKKSDEVTPEAQALFDGLVREFTNKGE